ncbi:MAG: hypothetical protein ACXAEL_03860 [Candidatus Hodarchaeales archaeon]
MKTEGLHDLQHELRELRLLLLGDDHNRITFLTRLLGTEKAKDVHQNRLIRTVLGNIPTSILSIKPPPGGSGSLLASAIKDSMGIVLCISSFSAKIRDYLSLIAETKGPDHIPPILLALDSETTSSFSGFAKEYGPTIAGSPFSQISITPDIDMTEQMLTWVRANIIWHFKDDLVELLRVAVFEDDNKPIVSLDMADVDWPIDLNSLGYSRFALIKTTAGILLVLGRLGFRAVLLGSERTDPDGLVILGESLIWEIVQAKSSGLEISPQTIADFLEHSSHYDLSISAMQPSRLSIHQSWPSVKSTEIYQSIHEDLKAQGSLDVIRGLIDIGRKLASKIPQEALNFLTGESFENALMTGWAPLAVVDADIEIREGSSKEGRLIICLGSCPFGSATESYLSRLSHRIPEWFGEVVEQYRELRDEEAVGPLCVIHQSYREHLFDRLAVGDSEVFLRQIACRGGPGMMAFDRRSDKYFSMKIEELMQASHCAFAIFFGGQTPSDQTYKKLASEIG